MRIVLGNLNKIKKNIKEHWQLYLLLSPSLIYLLIFAYAPMVGISIAFKDYDPVLGFAKSPFIGLGKFKMFFDSYYFWTIIKNTLIISVYALIINTPLPIILALLLNEVSNEKFKRFVQTISYAPFFISLVVLVGIVNSFLDPSTGVINQMLMNLGFDNINFIGDDSWFRTIYVFSGLWQGIGWWSIIYLGTLSNVDPALHEAAVMEGASRIDRIRHINIPTILPVAIILFIMAIGSMMSVGFEKIFLMQNPSNMEVSEVISTYTYRISFLTTRDFSFGTAVGVFNSLVNIILLLIANVISKKVSQESLW